MKSRLSALTSTIFSGVQKKIISRAILVSSPNISSFKSKCRSFSSFQHDQDFVALRRALLNSHSRDDFSELGPPVPESAASQWSLQYQAFEASRRAVPKSSSKDDFSELGPPTAKSAAAQLKLAKKKPEPFMKTDPAGKASANWPISDLDRTSRTSYPEFHNHHNVKWKDTLKVDSSSCSISNEDVTDSLDGCEVDSENSESSGRDLPNHPPHAVKTVTIRIQGIGKETTDPIIHSLCKSMGALEGFARADTDSVDALFRVTDDTDAQGIIQRLNNTVIDDSHWSAYQILRDTSSTPSSVSEEVRSKLGLRINNSLMKLRRQLDMKNMYFADLQLLHVEIMHLQDLPTIRQAHED